MIRYERHRGPEAALLSSALMRLYAVVYAEPPYLEGPDEVGVFAERFARDLDRPGAELVTAHDGDALVGAVYGWAMAAGAWWQKAGGAAPDGVVAAEKLAVMEWLVAPDRRGEGIGAALMRLLLEGRPEGYATLAADPRSPARNIYERAGWRPAGTISMAWGTPMDLLVLPLV